MLSDNNVSSVEASNNSQDKSKPNPFDPASLRIATGGGANLSIKKVITTIPVKKPSREMYVRTSPKSEHTEDLLLLELKDESEVYLVIPELHGALVGEATVSVKTLIVTKTRQSNIILWPLKAPNGNGRTDHWLASAWQAAAKKLKVNGHDW